MKDPRFSDVRITQVGDGNIGQQFNNLDGQARDPLDDLPDDAMAAFVRATAQSLAALQLSVAALDQARQTLDEIRLAAAEERPERNRLRQLASTLHRIVEEAAGHALGAAVLGLWHPV